MVRRSTEGLGRWSCSEPLPRPGPPSAWPGSPLHTPDPTAPLSPQAEACVTHCSPGVSSESVLRPCLQEDSRPTARRTGPSRRPPRTLSGRVSPLAPRRSSPAAAPRPSPGRCRPAGATPSWRQRAGHADSRRLFPAIHTARADEELLVYNAENATSARASGVAPPEHCQRGQGRETWSERGPGHPECNMQDSRTVTATGGATVSLLGLLAKIKCSICSYQFNI